MTKQEQLKAILELLLNSNENGVHDASEGDVGFTAEDIERVYRSKVEAILGIEK